MQQTELKSRSRHALDRAAISEFVALFKGTVYEPVSPGYDEARRIWNAMIDRRPGLIAMCTSMDDVVQAVRFARAFDLETAVRAGGHNVAGRALCDDGIVIDVSRMKSISVDTSRNIVEVQAGATLGELDEATAAYGLAVPVGVAPPTGIAGLTLGGGVGWLTRKFGMTCDNVLGFEVVMADGTVQTADPDNNPDLFWALRGGGGNFGIVTAFRFQAHPVSTVLGGVVFYPRDQARGVLKFYREFMKTAPDELTAYVGFVSLPDGPPVIGVMGCYCGDLVEGENVLRPLRAFGTPVVDVFQTMPFVEMQKLAHMPFDRPTSSYWRTAFLNEFSDAAIDVIVENVEKAESPLTGTFIHLFGGAAGRVPEDATAFAQRKVRYSIGIEAQGLDPAENERHIGWARNFARALEAFTGSGYLLNFLHEEGDEIVRQVFGSNYARLTQIKAKYDPENFFRNNQNIVPMNVSRDLG